MLSQKKKIVIAAIVAGASITDACNKAKIRRSTFYEWMKDSKFKNELELQKKELNEYIYNRTVNIVRSAIDKLESLVEDGNETAIYKTIDFYVKLRKMVELEDMEERIKQLESVYDNN